MNQIPLPFSRIMYVIICCVLLASCYPGTVLPDPYIVSEDRQKENVYYIPGTPNTPLANKKNDVDFNIMHSSGTRFSGFEMQAAYLPTDHIGIIAGYTTAKNNGGTPDYMTHNSFELGAGYIKSLHNGWHFETYAGGGSGDIKNYHYTGYSNIGLTHFFIQPAIAVSDMNNRVTFAFISRFNGVHFSVKDTLFNTDREQFSTKQFNSLYKDPFHLMWEPGIVFKAGWKNFKFHVGYSFSADLTNADLHRATNNLSLGVSLQFNTKERVKTKG